MKKILRFFLILIIIGIVGILAYFIYFKFFASKGSVDAFNSVPKEAVFVVETTNLSEAWTTIHNSDLWLYLIQTDYFADLNKDIETINKFLDSNTVAGTILKNRKLIIAAVMATPKDWDFLYIVDLEKSSATIKSLKNLTGFIKGYDVNTIEFKTEKNKFEIIELTDQKNKDSKIFISFADNILLVSFNGAIIQKSLEQLDDKHWQNDKKFTEIIQQIPGRKQFKIYLNYSNLNQFTTTFLTTEDATISMIGQSLAYSVFNLEIKEDYLSFDGFANLDSTGGYIKALADVKPGEMKAFEIMSDQTAAFVSVTFEDYIQFYENLMTQYKENYPDDAADIDQGMNLLKKVIKIDVEKDFFSWIGNEISICKIRPLSGISKQEDVVLYIHSNNIENSKTGMERIVNQIRKWSPFKFTDYQYKNFNISYLKQKKFFNLFFGKLFEGIEEPYFTYIDDYVVFSNSQEVLHQIIDDYIAGRILKNNEKFNNFIKKFDKNANIGVFVVMPKMYPTLYFFTPEKDKKSLEENEQLIKSISRFGFQLVSKNDFFKALLFAQYDSEAYYEDLTEVIENQIKSETFIDYVDSLGFKINLKEGTPDGPYSEYFDNTNQNIKYDGKVVNGKPEGLWRTYYENGNIECSVTYSDGKIDGIAYFYYDDVSNTLRTEAIFEEDKINGIYKEYYENGARKANIIFKDGDKEGEAFYYYNTGETKITGNFKKDLKDGKWQFYDDQGKLIYTEKWNNGEKKK